MRAGAGGNHPEVPGSRNALFSTNETHAANSRQREPAASRPRRRDVGNLSVGQTAGRGSDLPDRRLNRRKKPIGVINLIPGRFRVQETREEGAAKGSRPWLFVPSIIPGSRLSAPGTRRRSVNEKRPGQSERKYSCTVPRRGKEKIPLGRAFRGETLFC